MVSFLDFWISFSYVIVFLSFALLLKLQFSAAVKDHSKPRETPRQQTVRVSNIPSQIDREEFYNAITGLSLSDSELSSEANLVGWSYASAATGPYFVATATFLKAVPLHEIETSLKIDFGREAARLRVDTEFLGLTVLHELREQTTVDIIAVTGLAGHAFSSWKARGGTAMWLRDFLPEKVPDARILIYGYDTTLPGSQSEASVTDLSRKLLESIKSS